MPLVSTSYLSFVPRGVFFWVVKRKEGALQHLDRVDLWAGDTQERLMTRDRAEPPEEQRPLGETRELDFLPRTPSHPHLCPCCPLPFPSSSQRLGLSGVSQVSLCLLVPTACPGLQSPTHLIVCQPSPHLNKSPLMAGTLPLRILHISHTGVLTTRCLPIAGQIIPHVGFHQDPLSTLLLPGHRLMEMEKEPQWKPSDAELFLRLLAPISGSRQGVFPV